MRGPRGGDIVTVDDEAPPPRAASPGSPGSAGGERDYRSEIDNTTAHAARVYDYLLGGVDNFEADRVAAERASAAHPGGIETSRANVRANRMFLVQAVRYLVTEGGIRQFLDIGTGIPNADNTHATALRGAPDARVVCVDNDPTVLSHAQAMLGPEGEGPVGAVQYLDGDLRHPDQILRQAAATLDFTEPVAVMLVSILHFLGDEERPEDVVAELLDAVPPGSYLVASHLAKDIQPDEMAELAERLNRQTQERFVMRGRSEVARFFEGLEMIGPGLAPLNDWLGATARALTPGDPGSGSGSGSGSGAPRPIPFYGGIGRKP
jgi:SAM-dependent methyltransferase